MPDLTFFPAVPSSLRDAGGNVSARPKNLAYPVTIGAQVTWYPKSERWRIEVVEPSSMTAVYITHEALVRITRADSHDPGVIAGWLQVHRDVIEELIGDAEMEHWPDRIGILPHGTDGFYQR